MQISFLKSAYKENHYPPADKPEIAFAGRSNVGKSSLINVLVNRKKMARTSSTPGRTQAINYFMVNQALYFVDLPGYGFARVPLSVKKSWGHMVENYLRDRINLRAVVVIFDIRRDLSQGDFELLNWLDLYGVKTIIVLTKVDKISKNRCAIRVKFIEKEIKKYSPEGAILFSAKTRQGREQIWEKIRIIIET